MELTSTRENEKEKEGSVAGREWGVLGEITVNGATKGFPGVPRAFYEFARAFGRIKIPQLFTGRRAAVG